MSDIENAPDVSSFLGASDWSTICLSVLGNVVHLPLTS
jgi:hypothetical protein